MKIKFIKEPTSAGYGYFTGDIADLPESVANELIKDKLAVSVKDLKAAEKAAEKEAAEKEAKE